MNHKFLTLWIWGSLLPPLPPEIKKKITTVTRRTQTLDTPHSQTEMKKTCHGELVPRQLLLQGYSYFMMHWYEWIMLTTFPIAIPAYRVFNKRLQYETSTGGFRVVSARRHVSAYRGMFEALCRRIGMSAHIWQILIHFEILYMLFNIFFLFIQDQSSWIMYFI